MCKRNSPDKKKKKKSQHGMCKRNSPHKSETSSGSVRNSTHKNEANMGCVGELPRGKLSQLGMCKRNSPRKNEARTGCVGETPQIKKEGKKKKKKKREKKTKLFSWGVVFWAVCRARIRSLVSFSARACSLAFLSLGVSFLAISRPV